MFGNYFSSNFFSSDFFFTKCFRYRLKVSNLNASVSESDLVKVFCAIGAIRNARLLSTTGSAIITFVKRAATVTKHNGRDLDKQKISGMNFINLDGFCHNFDHQG